MTSLYLIRHAQAQGNVEQRFQGRIDLPLTDLGRKQARQLMRRMRAIPLDCVYASPLQRAVDTARDIAVTHNLPLVRHPGIMEMDGGAFENRTFEDIRATDGEELRIFMEQPHLFRGVGGGESFEALYERMRDEITGIVKGHPGATVAVVSHGAAIRAYLCHALGYPLERLQEVPWVANTGVSHIIYNTAFSPKVKYIGDDSHVNAGIMSAGIGENQVKPEEKE